MNKEKEKTDDIQEEVVEEKVNETTEGTSKSEPKDPVEVWDKADLVSVCGQCGEVTKVARYEGGVQWIVVTRSDSVFSIKCPKCENEMSLTFQNGRKFTEEEKEQKMVNNIKAKEERDKEILKNKESKEEIKIKEDFICDADRAEEILSKVKENHKVEKDESQEESTE